MEIIAFVSDRGYLVKALSNHEVTLSPENLENITTLRTEAWLLFTYEKKSVCEHESNEFEIWDAIRASVGGVGDMLEWVAWVAC